MGFGESMSAHEVKKVLSSLEPEQLGKLAKDLNASNCEELAKIKGIGPSTLAILLGISEWTIAGGSYTGNVTCGQIQQRWELLGAVWPTFSRKALAIHFARVSERSYQPDHGYIHEVLRRKKTILHLLAHFNICDTAVNEHLTELRDMRARLEIFRTMGDPVIRDYLKQIARDFA